MQQTDLPSNVHDVDITHIISCNQSQISPPALDVNGPYVNTEDTEWCKKHHVLIITPLNIDDLTSFTETFCTVNMQ